MAYEEGVINEEKNRYKVRLYFKVMQLISLGYGRKYTYKIDKTDETVPGPIYNTEYYRSIQKKIEATEPKKESTFGCDYDQQAKVMYPG